MTITVVNHSTVQKVVPVRNENGVLDHVILQPKGRLNLPFKFTLDPSYRAKENQVVTSESN